MVIKQLDYIPKIETMVSMPYFSTASGKIRHAQVTINNEGAIVVSNIDALNSGLNGSICFIKA